MAARIEVRLRPGAGRNELAGYRDGVLQVRVAAPPVDGRANTALLKLISKRLGVAPSRVSIVRGRKARDKLLEIDGIEPGRLRELLGACGA